MLGLLTALGEGMRRVVVLRVVVDVFLGNGGMDSIIAPADHALVHYSSSVCGWKVTVTADAGSTGSPCWALGSVTRRWNRLQDWRGR